ncbi:MAG: hypothetical protein SGARI_001267 [Bacillariaceae sp.]
MIATLQDCWQAYHTSEIPDLVSPSSDNVDPLSFQRHPEDKAASDEDNDNGRPGQLAHAATTYAAVLSLCILATDPNTSNYEGEEHYSTLAQEMLATIRIPLYRWMVSLQNPDGGYRMHHDGEVDVRATYTMMTCAKLLKLLHAGSVLQRTEVVDFCISCQTYEGGMGGEPFSEAHGGYTFCGVAALQLLGSLHCLDVDALQGWLARRQMPYEGGFSGRSNKLVDGCYSFWQGGATAIASSCCSSLASQQSDSAQNDDDDPWLKRYSRSKSTSESMDVVDDDLPFPLLLDVAMLERYILLCAQEIEGGLRDKPSKQRDHYHTCYNLSGLSVAQHCSSDDDKSYGDSEQTKLAPTHPCYNIRIDRVAAMLAVDWSEYEDGAEED